MSSRRNLSVYAALWIALVIVYSAGLTANGIALDFSVRNALANLLPGALLGLAVIRLPARVHWPEASRARFFLRHFGLLFAYLVLSTSGWLALMALDIALFDDAGTTVLGALRFLPWHLIHDTLVYCTLISIAYAQDNAKALREQAERTAKAEALRARAALEAMRSQLNPHFILNTFHTVLGLVRREPAIAEAALERLGDLLRYSLRVHRDGIDEVPLRDECALVENYLELERLRLGDRLRATVDAPATTHDCLVPTFAVQILVENAVRHALAPRAAGGELTVRAETIDGRLRVAVQDEANGERLEPPAEGSKLGLRLLQERLDALYSGNAALTIAHRESGTSAELDLPARTRETEAAE